MRARSLRQAIKIVSYAAAMGLSFCLPTETYAQAWPNEPAGSQVLTDWGFNNTTLPAGWYSRENPIPLASAGDAPLSPSSVLQARYPTGFAGGGAPIRQYFPLPSGTREMYVGYWWKASDPWHGHSSNVNKITFILGDLGHIIPVMYGPPGGPYQLRVAPEWGNWSWLTPNRANGIVALGQWHRVELYFKQQAAGGIIRWWMDGQLVGEYTNISFPDINFQEFQFSPTWGGVGDAKTQTDYFQWDHVHLSRPGSGAPPADKMPPAKLKNLRTQ